jgi:membrane associated rhomboid family serine protease
MPLHDESSLMTLGLLGTIGIMAICWFAYPGHLLLISCSGLVFALVGAWAIYAYQKARIRNVGPSR